MCTELPRAASWLRHTPSGQVFLKHGQGDRGGVTGLLWTGGGCQRGGWLALHPQAAAAGASQLRPVWCPGAGRLQEGTGQQPGCFHRSVHNANGGKTLRPTPITTALPHATCRKEKGKEDRPDLLFHQARSPAPWPPLPRPADIKSSPIRSLRCPGRAAGCIICKENCLCIWGLKLESA